MEDQGNAHWRKGSGDLFQVRENRDQEEPLSRSPAPEPRSLVCMQCGTCCVAPDIATLQKPVGVRCRHLGRDNRCRIYAERPAVCQRYRPDAICREIAAPDLESRVARYLSLFGLG